MRIAFASCAKIQDRDEQPVWTAIRAAEPDVLLLLGDNVYVGGKPEGAAELRRKLIRWRRCRRFPASTA